MSRAISNEGTTTVGENDQGCFADANFTNCLAWLDATAVMVSEIHPELCAAFQCVVHIIINTVHSAASVPSAVQMASCRKLVCHTSLLRRDIQTA